MNPNRRSFLETTWKSSTLLALAGQAPGFLCRTANGAAPRQAGGEGRVLVVIQLSGGNDGLNCVVPYADDEYARRRNTLRLKPSEVLRVDGYWGFHPALQECRRLFEEGRFSVVQGVGYPKSSRDHVAAERSWQSALPGDAEAQTGWVGRYADWAAAQASGEVPVALVTPASRPFALTAERAIVPQVRGAGDVSSLAGLADDRLQAECERLAAVPRTGEANPLLEFVRLRAEAAARKRPALQAAVASSQSYPQTRFAQRLRTIAGLIRAEAGFRLFYTELGGDGFGGFDNHANQKENHAALLGQLSGGLAAFLDDLRRDGLEDRVLLMTISEFGRTVAENGRRGTDHGAAAPVFLAGGGIKPGLIGAHPSLADLDDNALRFHTDFRQVYATVLERWLRCDARGVLGEAFAPVDMLRPA